MDLEPSSQCQEDIENVGISHVAPASGASAFSKSTFAAGELMSTSWRSILVLATPTLLKCYRAPPSTFVSNRLSWADRLGFPSAQASATTRGLTTRCASEPARFLAAAGPPLTFAPMPLHKEEDPPTIKIEFPETESKFFSADQSGVQTPFTAREPALSSMPTQTLRAEQREKWLQLFKDDKFDSGQAPSTPEESHTLRVAPLFSSSICDVVPPSANTGNERCPQYGLLGLIDSDYNTGNTKSPCNHASPGDFLLTNTEEPWSTFICGSQGSGKSHTLSCLLENSLMLDPNIGNLKAPLTGLVFHYDKFSNFGGGQVCEAAYLCSAARGGIPVRVLVAPTSLNRMARQYHNLPGLPTDSARPQVLPLYFTQEQLSVDTMMTLMAVDDTGESAPLYICAIRQLLREIAMETQDKPGFDYLQFRDRLARMDLVPGQLTPLQMRLQLLQSVLLGEVQSAEARAVYDEIWTFKPGTLTIIDLSDQFVSETDTCAFFSICLKLFMADWQANPRVIALDEAHKFLTASTEATKLTNDLVSVIRQQRHMSARVVVATQEPTVSNILLDLCNVSIIHRFNSPTWYKTLHDHLAGARTNSDGEDSLFREIVRLSTGEALVFCPTAVVQKEFGESLPLQDGRLKIRVRNRVSADGGCSNQASSRLTSREAKFLPVIPKFQRLNTDRIPDPGSLARKEKSKSGTESSATCEITVTNAASNDQYTSHGRQLSEGNSPAPSNEPKRQKVTEGTSRKDSSAPSSTHASLATKPQPSSLSSMGKDDKGPVTSRLQLQAPTGPKSSILAIEGYQIPAKSSFRKEGIFEDHLENAMYRAILATLGSKTIKDPSIHMEHWFQVVGAQYGIKARALRNMHLRPACQSNTGKIMMQRVVRRYYDDKNVGYGKNERKSDLPWLAG